MLWNLHKKGILRHNFTPGVWIICILLMKKWTLMRMKWFTVLYYLLMFISIFVSSLPNILDIIMPLENPRPVQFLVDYNMSLGAYAMFLWNITLTCIAALLMANMFSTIATMIGFVHAMFVVFWWVLHFEYLPAFFLPQKSCIPFMIFSNFSSIKLKNIGRRGIDKQTIDTELRSITRNHYSFIQ